MEARRRAGITGKTVALTVAANDPLLASQRALIRPNLDRMARGVPIDGEVYCYLAIHPLEDRKRDTFMGVAADPVEDLYRHNHALQPTPAVRLVTGPVTMRTKRSKSETSVSKTAITMPGQSKKPMHRDTHMAAPYWSMASVSGPLLCHAMGAMVKENWCNGTRGIKSKMLRGRVIAKEYGLAYFGRDIVSEKTQDARDARAQRQISGCMGPAVAAQFLRIEQVARCVSRIKKKGGAATPCPDMNSAGDVVADETTMIDEDDSDENTELMAARRLAALLDGGYMHPVRVAELDGLFRDGRVPITFTR